MIYKPAMCEARESDFVEFSAFFYLFTLL